MNVEAVVIEPVVEAFRLWFMMKGIPYIIFADLGIGVFFFLFGGFREKGKQGYIIAGIIFLLGHFVMMIILNMPFNLQYV